MTPKLITGFDISGTLDFVEPIYHLCQKDQAHNLDLALFDRALVFNLNSRSL